MQIPSLPEALEAIVSDMYVHLPPSIWLLVYLVSKLLDEFPGSPLWR